MHTFRRNTGIGRTGWTDRQTDGQTEMVKQYRALYAVPADVQ